MVSDRRIQSVFDKKTKERLDVFLTEQLPEFSRSRIQGFIKEGFVSVNGKPATKAGQVLELRDQIEVRIPPQLPSNMFAEDIPLDIIF